MTSKDVATWLKQLKKEAQYNLRVIRKVISDEQLEAFQSDIEALGKAADILNGYDTSRAAMADELRATLSTDELLLQSDRALFVRNLGTLLAQTRCGVTSCTLRCDTVVIHYNNGYTREIDVTADSYLAIVRDVARHV